MRGGVWTAPRLHVSAAAMENLRTAAAAVLPPGMKRKVKRLVRAYQQRLFAFTPADFRRVLVDLGVAPGDVLMVHSGFDRFVGFRGGPLDVIRILQDVVGTSGTLLMPTIPFRGTAIEYALDEPVFDARATVSQMGLISEVFRRSPGVVRSRHPTHSVAAWGERADDFIAWHEYSGTPCGRLTPYGRLLEYDGKLLLAGVSASAVTFGYFVAEELAPRLPIRVLTDETYALRWKDAAGGVHVSHVHLFAPGLDHDGSPIARELKRRGQWRERRVGGRLAGFGGLQLALLRARDYYEAAAALAERGEFLSG
jgi:aminoglycoside N3'-acetyltransferase